MEKLNNTQQLPVLKCKKNGRLSKKEMKRFHRIAVQWSIPNGAEAEAPRLNLHAVTPVPVKQTADKLQVMECMEEFGNVFHYACCAAMPSEGTADTISVEDAELRLWGSLVHHGKLAWIFSYVAALVYGDVKKDGSEYDPDHPPWKQTVVIHELTKVWQFGRTKYPPLSWQQVTPEQFKGALWRHFLERNLNMRDAESRQLHSAHMLFNVLGMVWHEMRLSLRIVQK